MKQRSNSLDKRTKDMSTQVNEKNSPTLTIKQYFGNLIKLSFESNSVLSISLASTILVNKHQVRNMPLLEKQNQKSLIQLDIISEHVLFNHCKSIKKIVPLNVGKNVQDVNLKLIENEDKFPFITDKNHIIWLKNYLKTNDLNSSNIADFKHPHKIEFYNMNKNYINIIKGKFDGDKKNLFTYYGILSKFSKFQGLSPLKYGVLLDHRNKTGSEDLNKLILKFIDRRNKYYVVKRCFFEIQNWDSTSTKGLLEKIMADSYKEYGLMKLFNACPYSVEPIETQFIYIENLSYFITELLMEFGGETLQSLINDTTKKNLFTEENVFLIFSQLIMALNYLESYKIEHNDIKPENIVIEFDESSLKAKLIDFNIGENNSTTKKTLSYKFRGMSPGFESPELYGGDINSQEFSYDPYFCQMFSFGITCLYLLNFFNLVVTQNEFIELTRIASEENKKKIKNYFSRFSLVIRNKSLLWKIFEVCKMCISYNPNERITANQLSKVLHKINSKTATTEELIDELNLYRTLNLDTSNIDGYSESRQEKIKNEYYFIDGPLENLKDKLEEVKKIKPNIQDENNKKIQEKEKEKIPYFDNIVLTPGNKSQTSIKPNIIPNKSQEIKELISNEGYSAFNEGKLKEGNSNVVGYFNFKDHDTFYYIGEIDKEVTFDSFVKLDKKEKNSSYYGRLLNNKMDGLGIMKKEYDNTKETYFGYWRNDRRQGEGFCIYENLLTKKSETYLGNWDNNQKNGKGTMKFFDGRKYVGDWIKDKKQGHGKMKENGEIYDGEWLNDLRNGLGYLLIRKKQTEKYSVEYENDKIKFKHSLNIG